MKRIYLVSALLVVGLLLAASVSFAGNDDSSEVLFSIGQYLELNVTEGEVVDFGQLDPTPGNGHKNAITTTHLVRDRHVARRRRRRRGDLHGDLPLE